MQSLGRVAHELRVTSGECIRAAWKAAPELERQVERDTAGDVRRPIGPIQPSREVQSIDVDGSLSVPAWHRRVQHETASDRAAGAGELNRCLEPGQRPLQMRFEARVDGDVLETVEHASPLLEGKPAGAYLQVERGRDAVLVDSATERERGARRLQQQPIEPPTVRSTPDRARQVRHRQLRSNADP